MAKLNAGDLEKIQDRVRKENRLSKDRYTVKITVHMGTCGIAAGADKVYEALNDELDKCGEKNIKVVISACMGMCSSEPNVTVWRMDEDAVLYKDMDADKMRRVFQEHVLGGEIQNDCAMARIKDPV